MPQQPYTNEEIQAGKAVRQELFQKAKGNFEDLALRTGDLEVSIGTEKPLSYHVVGSCVVADGLIVDKLLNNIRILSVKVYVPIAGLSGTLQVDIEYKRGAGAWTSVLSAPIQVTQASGDGAIVSGTIAVQDLNYNDQIRVNSDALQVSCPGWSVKIEHEKRAA